MKRVLHLTTPERIGSIRNTAVLLSGKEYVWALSTSASDFERSPFLRYVSLAPYLVDYVEFDVVDAELSKSWLSKSLFPYYVRLRGDIHLTDRNPEFGKLTSLVPPAITALLIDGNERLITAQGISANITTKLADFDKSRTSHEA